jgi:putative transposase
MARESTPTFVHTFELRQPKQGWASARQSEDHCRRLYNAALGFIVKRIQKLKSSPHWIAARQRKGKERSELFNAATLAAGVSGEHVRIFVRDTRNGSPDFQRFVGSHVAQNIAVRAWETAEKYLYAKAKRVRFKRKGEPFRFEGSDNKTFLRFQRDKASEQPPYVQLAKQRYEVIHDPKNPYEQHALNCRVKYVRWVRKVINGRDRFYAQLVLEGFPCHDEEKAARAKDRLTERLGELPIQNAPPVIGLDFGPRKLAVSTATQGFICDLGAGIANHQKRVRQLQRKVDRQRRANNPDRFDEKGRIKPIKGKWNKSQSQKRTEQDLSEIQRKTTATRKRNQGALANELLQLGNVIKTEDISFRALQKRYGKSVGKCAPSAFLSELTRKAEYARGWCEQINTFQTALSQVCICGSRSKKPLSQRVHKCERCGLGLGVKVDRDLFSAYLAVHTRNTPSTKKKGQKVTWESSVDLNEACKQIMGHRTLSQAAKSAASLKVQSAGASPVAVHAGTVEDLATRSSRPSLEPSRKFRMRDVSKPSRIPHLKPSDG